jgi:hypothetical protein
MATRARLRRARWRASPQPAVLAVPEVSNLGRDRLQLTAIHHSANFVTEWLDPLTPDQRDWSSQHR